MLDGTAALRPWRRLRETGRRLSTTLLSVLDDLGRCAAITPARRLVFLNGHGGNSALLEEAEALTDRHQSRLDRAGRAVTRISRAAGESRQMVAIVVLIVVLVLLIAYWK